MTKSIVFHVKKIRDNFNMDITIDVPTGQHIAVCGPSGVGKSTLLDGCIHHCQMNNIRYGRVFQQEVTAMVPHWTVLENVWKGVHIGRKIPQEVAIQEAKKWLAMVGIDDIHHQKHPEQLSGGQTQRVGIARSLMGQPDIIFLDEPTSALDGLTKAEVLKTLKQLKHQQTSIMLITHSEDERDTFAERIISLKLKGTSSIIESDITK